MTAALRGPPADTENPPDAEFGDTRPRGSERDEAERLPRIIDRLGEAKRRGESTMGWLAAEHNRLVGSRCDSEAVDDLKRAAEKLRGCGQHLEFHHYYTVGKLRLAHAYFCKQHLICPACAVRRGSKLMARYIQKIEAVRGATKLALLTYTVKNGHDLAERLDHLSRGLAVLKQRRVNARRPTRTGKRRKRPTEWGAIAGAVGSIEVTWDTKNGTGWHPHCHMLVLLDRYIDRDALCAEWQAITGDSFMVDIRELDSSKSGDADELVGELAEVFKYAVKFSSLDPAQLWHCRSIISGGTRLLFNLGSLFGVPEPDELTDDSLEGLPYIEHLLRYTRGLGYAYSAAPRVVEPATAPEEPDDGSEIFESPARQADLSADRRHQSWGVKRREVSKRVENLIELGLVRVRSG